MATDGSRWPAWESAATRRPRLSLERHVVLLAVVGGDRLDGDLPADHGPEALDGVGPLRLQIARRVRVDADQHLLPGSFLGTGLNLAEDLRGQGRIGLHDAAALAGRARRAEERLQALAHALARHLDQSQLGDLEHVGASLVLREHPRQGLEDLVAVLKALHVYEVDDDDPAQVSQSDLADDLGHRFQVDLEHGLLEVPLTHVLAGVDVDGHQGLGVVDDDVAARLEPDAAPQGLLDLLLDPGGLEDGHVLVPKLHAARELGNQRGRELHAFLVGAVVVYEELVHLGREEVPDHAEREIHLLVPDRGRPRRLEAALDLGPQAAQELDVGRQILLALPLGDRPHDEPTARGAEALHDPAQALPLLILADPARDPDVARLRHVDDGAAGQRDEGGDAGAL